MHTFHISLLGILLIHSSLFAQWQLDTSGRILIDSTQQALDKNWIDAQCLRHVDSATLCLEKLNSMPLTDTAQLLLLDYFKAKLLFQKGRYNQSISVATQTMRKWEYDDIHRLSFLYDLMSEVFIEKGYPDKAFEYSMRNTKKNETISSKEKLALSTIQLAAVQINNDEYRKGLVTLDRAFQYYQSNKKEAPYYFFLHQAKAYLKTDQFQKARDRINTSLFISKKNNWPIAEGQSLLFESELLIQEGLFNDALIKIQLAKDRFQSANFRKGMADVDMHLSLYYFYSTDYNRAIQFAQKAADRLDEMGSMHPLLFAHQQLFVYHAAMNDYKNALVHFRYASTIKDSIFSIDKTREKVETEIKYKSKILEREKAELMERNKNQALELEIKEKELNIKDLSRTRLILFVSILGALTLLLVLYYTFRSRNRVLKENLRANELEQRALRAQMNPHFMFNSLNSIQSLIASGKNSDASIYLAKFSRLMRQILNNSREAFISLQSEIDFLHNYVVLEQRRFKESFDFNVEVDPALDAMYVMIPPMILQPFLENAILHGLLRLEKKGQLTVQFMDHDRQFIKCVVDDNGIGREAAKKFNHDDERKSLGLKITAQRLLILSQKIKHKFDLINIIDKLDVDSTASGTKVEIYIPKRYKI